MFIAVGAVESDKKEKFSFNTYLSDLKYLNLKEFDIYTSKSFFRG
jgi:hypothetical protein